MSCHPKALLINFFDDGVYRALRSASILDKVTEIEGAALDGLVAQHLRAGIDYTEEQHALYFWRTKVGLEVDFIVYGTLGLWAIEVKDSRQVSTQIYAHCNILKKIILKRSYCCFIAARINY